MSQAQAVNTEVARTCEEHDKCEETTASINCVL